MSWEKLILRKIRISTSDTARQCPQSEVDDVWQILEKPASRLMDAQPDLKEHVPSHLLLSGLHGRRRRRNIKPSPEMPRIEGTPRGAFVPHPKRESSSGSWNEVIKQNDDAQPEPIQEFQQEPEDPNPGHSSQTNKVLLEVGHFRSSARTRGAGRGRRRGVGLGALDQPHRLLPSISVAMPMLLCRNASPPLGLLSNECQWHTAANYSKFTGKSQSWMEARRDKERNVDFLQETVQDSESQQSSESGKTDARK
ncbi:Hypothetical predicted protein [Cloeon dipterum]|uniref:Uncharacterized protein n=1 Tax=Cloeon dipterum TaxID=197152 RepID=A0A8S1CLJ4_9INSE|nr:Hypothetical predicted protein [Cloeon dipterum]